MRTFPLRDAEGRLVAVEIENAYIGVRRLARVIRGAEGVAHVQARRPFARWEDVRVRFTWRGRACVAVEIFGDNSRYWIGPADPGGDPFDATPLEAALRAYRVPPLAQFVGDLVSLRAPFLRSA